MKPVLMILGLVVFLGVGFGLYYSIQYFEPETFISNQTKKVGNTIDDAKQNATDLHKKGEGLLQSGLQTVQSGAQTAIASGEQLIQQKKKEAEAYLLQQKLQLQAEAKARVQAEAKKQIDSVFNGN